MPARNNVGTIALVLGILGLIAAIALYVMAYMLRGLSIMHIVIYAGGALCLLGLIIGLAGLSTLPRNSAVSGIITALIGGVLIVFMVWKPEVVGRFMHGGQASADNAMAAPADTSNLAAPVPAATPAPPPAATDTTAPPAGDTSSNTTTATSTDDTTNAQ